MYSLSPEDNATLAKLNSSYRTKIRKTRDSGPSGVIVAEIVDLVTGEPYAQATGLTELDAVHAAIEIAKTARKPYATGEDHAADSLREEHARLTRELAEIRAKQSKGTAPTQVKGVKS